MPTSTQGFATRAIHSGYDPMSEQGAVTPPLHMTSTFCYETAEDGGAMFAGEKAGHFYSRVSNPTLDILERRMADLEGGEAAVSTASGMGAITSALWTFLEAGDELITDMTLYGCTFSFLNHGLSKFGIKVIHVDMTDPEKVAAAITPKTKVIYFETPANPNMRLIDIAAVSDMARAHDILTVVDNTYATPYITRPIELGADIVVHSATKYLGGHGDLIAGIVVGKAEHIMRVRLEGVKDMTGAAMSPFSAMLVMRGLKTLELRMERHCKSAMTMARILQAHGSVETLYYPGLETFPQHDLAKKQMGLFGGMIAMELKGGYDAGVQMMNRLTLIRRAVSLGDADSLIQHPASMTHSAYTPEERKHHGISEGLVRLSVGLENPDDLLADLMSALTVRSMRAA
ncbi:MAG: methionine gamma-lyase [Alphaproteobacteria bacterium]